MISPFAGDRPLPTLPPGVGLSFVDGMNLTEDSLGPAKVIVPSLRTAASFDQLGQFLPAQVHYEEAMETDIRAYWYGLFNLRTCWLHLKLPRIDAAPLLHSHVDPDLMRHPPFFQGPGARREQTGDTAFAFTSFSHLL
jgi:hypothetical protein